MPQANPELQLLRGLTKEELQVVPERCDWCGVRETKAPADELSKRIRDSIKRNVSNGNITYSEAMHSIRRNVIIPGPKSDTQEIRRILRGTPVARSVGGGTNGGARESWFSAQLYGGLSTALMRPYEVKLEEELNNRNRPTPDIYVEAESGSDVYVIEVKRAAADLNGAEIQRQLKKYHMAVRAKRAQTRERTFLCIVGEDIRIDSFDEPRKSKPVSEYTDVPKTIDEIEDELDRVDVIGCTFN